MKHARFPKAMLAGAATLAILATATVSGATETQADTAPPQLPPMSPALGDDQPLFYGQTHGESEWYYTSGTHRIERGRDVKTRRVQVWAAPDGRYRAKSESLDGSGAYEEIAYDGNGNQLVKIVAGRGAEPAFFVVRNDKHFAIADSRAADDQRIVRTSETSTGSSSARYSSGAVTHHSGDPSVLAIDVQEDVVVGTGANLTNAGAEPAKSKGGELLGTDQSEFRWARSSTSASRRIELVDLYYRPCMEVRNFRNISNDRFTASSRRISDLSQDHACKWMHVAVWAFGYLNGHCVIDWRGQGPITAYYSGWSGTVDNSGWQESHGSNVAACSSHTAWDQYWTPHISGYYLPAAIAG